MIERKKATVRLTSRIDGDENINLYPGEYAFRDGTHLITYTDYAGNGITRNGIQANDSAMLLHRVGEFEGDMLFDPGMDTVMKYTAGGLVQTGFILHTEEYSADALRDMVAIHIRYVLFDGSGEEAIHGEQWIKVYLENEEA